jgi:hypothetical protein
MQAAAHLGNETIGSSWRVSRDGNEVAVVQVRHEGGGVVVCAELGGEGAPKRTCPNRFPTLRAAELFVADLIASFSYLGCEVACD